MTSFDEATRQVTDLMVAIGGSVDAYEDEKTSSAPPAPAINSFEAAHASVQAHIQHNEVVPSLDVLGILPNPLEEKPEYVEETPEDYPSSADEDSWTTQEESFFKEMNIDLADIEKTKEVAAEPVDDRFNAEFFDSLTGAYEFDQAPLAVEPFYKLVGSVYGLGELQEIYTAFKFSKDTGEPQKVILDSGEYEMTPAFGGENWELHDTGKGRKYVQESVHHMGCGEGNHYDLIEDDDLFIWVIPDDDSVEDLGYLHNQWAFLREVE